MTDVTTADGRVSGLLTDDGAVAADEVVCAAGPWNVELARRAGVDLPVRHTLAPILKFRTNERAEYSLPTVSHHESPYSIYRQASRERGAVYVGYNPSGKSEDVHDFLETHGTYDPDETDDTVPEEVREGATEFVDRLMPSLRDADLVDEWVGIRSVTPDENPVVGWTDLEGFSVAAFHTSGIQLSPKVGDVVASQLVDGEPTDLYDALSVSRFEGYTDVHGGSP
jgi:glycine/D-amino acid oxidase-like deaminating enzyme